MEKLSLSWEERLNLKSILGETNWQARELRQAWKVMDRLDLSEEEKAAVSWQQRPNGVEAWNLFPAAPPAEREYEFSSFEWNLIKRAMETYAFPARRRKDVQRLLDVFCPEGA